MLHDRDRSITSAAWFPLHSKGCGADFICTPAPVHNADGSESEMCGNGIRCVARYLQETGVPKSTYAFETPGGRRTVEIESFERIRVDMGAPIFEPGKIPVASEAPIWGKEIDVEGQNVKIYTLSMGNPHAVIFVGRSEQLNQVTTLGPKVERHSLFPRRTNVEFVHIKDGHLHVRVWERSAGETWACGTGASAAGVVALREKHVKNPVRVEFRGGTVEISWKDGESVFMTGPAGRVFEGEVDL